MEVEAVDEGILGKILIPEGTEGVAVNTPIAVIAGKGEISADAPARPPPQTATSSQRQPRAACRSAQPVNTRSTRAPRRSERNPEYTDVIVRSQCAKLCVTRWPKKCDATKCS